MRQANAAFVTKLGWRLLPEPDSLWLRVLRHKYCNGRCDLDMFLDKLGASNVWRRIIANVGNIKKGALVIFGNLFNVVLDNNP